MILNPIIVALSVFFIHCRAVRLHTLFQYLDGYKSDFNLRGFLHLGNDYVVFLRVPKAHDKFLVYELYAAHRPEDSHVKSNLTSNLKPRILAISKIPVEYIKEQLKTYRQELYKAKYVDANVVPGTEVLSVREWQLKKALELNPDGTILKDQPALRTMVL